MKRSVFLFALAFCAVGALAQSSSTTHQTSTPPATSTPPGANASALRPRGPEAVAGEEPNKVVATINGKSITAKEAADLLNSLPLQDRKRYETNLPQLIEQIYMEDQIAADALKENLDQQMPYKQQLQMSRNNILTQAYLGNLAKSPAAGEQAKKYYDAHAAEFDQVKVSGIIIAFNPPGTPANGSAVARTENDAQAKAMDLEKKIKGGADFSALARTDSDQQASATKGGDMGTFVMADPKIPDVIKDAVAKLQPGGVAEPVQIKGGYIILKLDTRTRLGFEQVKTSLIQKLELDKYKIHVDDEDFFSAPLSPVIPSLARPNAPANQPPSLKPPTK